MLYIVSTPIGNLSDITFRAVDTFKACDYILCEDTRYSALLLKHYGIKKPLKSFHKFNEASAQSKIIEDLNQGFSIALISDAGTPGISDPGAGLIQACILENIQMTTIPGPCAVISGLCLSGFDTDCFQFTGFLPKKVGDLKRKLQDILTYRGTTVCYESPHRLLEVLACLNELAPHRALAVARELTKKFEEVRRGKPLELFESWKETPLKGEIVLIIAGNTDSSDTDWNALTPQEHVELLQSTYRLTKQEAIQTAAKIRGTSKRDIYNAVHQ